MPQSPTARGFWADLGERERDHLAAVGRERRVAPGRRLFGEGDQAPSVVVLLEGRVKVGTATADGRSRLLALRGPGDLLGEMAALTDRRRTATVTAIDQVTALVVPADVFTELWRQEPAIASALVTALVNRVAEADRSRMDLLEDAPRRVERTVLQVADQVGRHMADGTVQVDAGLSQDDLACLAFTSRGVVASTLHALREAGLLRTGRRTLVVVDPEALAARVATQ